VSTGDAPAPFEGLPYAARAWLAHPYGVLRAVPIPDHPPPLEALARLLPEEQAFAAGLAPARLSTWVAGRLALAAALAELGAPRTPLLATPRGAPAVPAGFVGSISHKKRLAAAVAAPDEGACLGLDVEDAAPRAYDIAGRILRDVELAAVDALAPDARWRAVIVRFSIKEAIYKAVDPHVRRYVGFHEALVEPDPPGEGVREAAARLDPTPGEGPFSIEATWAELDGYVVSLARVRSGRTSG
jgi:enterobactin synthetase component D